MSEPITFILDGREVEALPGESIWQVIEDVRFGRIRARQLVWRAGPRPLSRGADGEPDFPSWAGRLERLG